MERERRIPAGFGLLIVALLAILIGGILLLDVDYDILPFLDTSALASARILLLVITVVAVVWVAMWVLGRLFQRVAIARVRSYGQVRSIWKLASYAVWAVVLLVLVLGLLGDVTSTALSVGLIGAALAFVLQKPLLDIAGWIIITYHRMYRIGDRVSLGGTRGYVVDVRLLHTELMETGEWMQGDTFTGRQVLIPNSVIFEGPTYNYTRDAPFVWDEVVNMVTYESDIDLAKTHMLEAAQEVVGEAMRSNYQRYLKNLPIRAATWRVSSSRSPRFA